MRSQFKPVAPASPSSSLSAPALYALTGKIQMWLAGLALLVVMAMLSLVVMSSSISELLASLALEEEFDSATYSVIASFTIGTMLVFGGIGLAFMWQVWQWLQHLTRYAAAPAPARAQAFLPPSRRLLIWVRVVQVVPLLLFTVGFVLSLAGQIMQSDTLNAAAEGFGFSLATPGATLGSALSMLLSFLILDSVREWLRALHNHARGSKTLVSTKLGKMGTWTLLWYLSLGLYTLSSLGVTLLFFFFALDKVPVGGKMEGTAAQIGLFSRISGTLQGTTLMFFLINVTLIVLLSLLRGYAAHVTTALDEHSLSARRQAQQEEGAHAANPAW